MPKGEFYTYPDPSTAYNFAFTLATIIDGRAVTPKGVDVTDDLRKFGTLPWEVDA